MNVNGALKRLHPGRLVIYNQALIVVNQGASGSPRVINGDGGLRNLIRSVGSSAVLKGSHSLDAIQRCCLLGSRIACSEIDEFRFGIGFHSLVELLEVKGGTCRSVDGLIEVLQSLLRLAAV